MERKTSFVLRLPSKLHEKLKKKAIKLNVSLNQLCIMLLSKDDLSELDMVTNKIKDVFQENLIGIVLFGSAARMTTHDSSDIDILIVLDRAVTRSDYRILDLDAPYSPSIVSFPKSASGFWYEIALDGVILSDSDGKLNLYLKELRNNILNGSIKRLNTHGQGYWI